MESQGTPTPAPAGNIASRLWTAARTEFSSLGYHGARVQGIAKRAGCNVALLYRHWTSKRALYVEILKSVWLEGSRQVASEVDLGGGAQGLVSAYLDVRMKDPEASQILIREILDGGPFLREIVASDPTAVQPLQHLMESIRQGDEHALRPGIDPEMAVLAVSAFAALAGSAGRSAELFFPGGAPSTDAWKALILDILLHGLEAR